MSSSLPLKKFLLYSLKIATGSSQEALSLNIIKLLKLNLLFAEQNLLHIIL